MNSVEYIRNILDTRGRFNCQGYCERHHIVPRCIGGTDDLDNLIDLYAYEHYEIHRLLALENPSCDGLIQAWWLMAFIENENQTRYFITAKEFEEIRMFYANHMSRKMSGEGNPMYGRSAFENKTEEEMTVIRQHMSESHIGQVVTDSTRELLRQQKLGDNNPMKKLTGDKHPNHGKKCYSAPDMSASGYFVPGTEPEGWVHKMKYNMTKSRYGENNPAAGKHWFNDGYVKILVKECPEHFHEGGPKSLPTLKEKELGNYLMVTYQDI